MALKEPEIIKLINREIDKRISNTVSRNDKYNRISNAGKSRKLASSDHDHGMPSTNLIISETTPESYAGLLWFKESTFKLYFYNGARWVEVSFSGCHITKTNQSVATGSWAAILHDTEDYDTDGYHSTDTNTERLTVSKDAYYEAGAIVDVDSADTDGIRLAAITKNGAVGVGDYVATKSQNATASQDTWMILVTPPLYLSEDDYLQLSAYQDSGSSLNVSTNFWIRKLG